MLQSVFVFTQSKGEYESIKYYNLRTVMWIDVGVTCGKFS